MGKKFFYFDSDTVPKLCEAINVGDAHALSLAPLVPELILLVRLNPPDLYEKNINGVRNIIKLNMQGCSTCLAFMEQLGKLVQLQSLHTWYRVHAESGRRGEKVSYGALSNLHTPECRGDGSSFSRYLACIPMKNLRILKSDDFKVIESLLTTHPSVQFKKLWLTCHHNESLIWNYLATLTSLTHLSLLYLRESPPASSIFAFKNCNIYVALAPYFANSASEKVENRHTE